MASDEQDLSSRKPRRSVIRSLSWKRPSKRTKMEENEQEAGVDANIDTTVHSHDGVDSGQRSFNTTAGSSHGMSDEDAEDTVFDSSAASSSKKRKKVGVWKAMKRFFSRKSGKGSKPQRSVSDPNLVHTSGERPDVAPIEEVQMDVDTHPKKAISHDSLLSELRSKHRNKDEEETSPTKQQVPVVLEVEVPDIDWETSASSTPEKLLPGLNVSHDKIRVAPRHRRAPTRKGVSSIRLGFHDVTDGNVIPRSRSVGARIPVDVIVEQPKSATNEQNQKALQEERKKLREKMEEDQRERKQQEEEGEKQKQLEQKLEQEKLEEQKREQEKLERERLERQKNEEEKLQRERLEKERLEQEKIEKEKLEQEKLEQEKLEQEKLEQEKLETERLEKEKQERLIKEQLEREQAENLRVEQEKLEKIKQDKLEELKREQEKLEQLKREQKKMEEEKIKEHKQQEVNKLSQFNIQQKIDFSDLAESLRSGDTKEMSSEQTFDVDMKETTSEKNAEKSKDMIEASPVDSRGVTLYQNIDIQEHTLRDISVTSTDETQVATLYQNADIEKQVENEQSESVKEQETSDVLNIKLKDATDDKESASGSVFSRLPPDNSATVSTNQESRGKTETVVVEPPENCQPMSTCEKHVHSGSMVGKYSEIVQVLEVKINEDEAVLPVEKEKSPSFSPPLSPLSSTTPTSPVRSKKLVVETPENVYQKPIMPDIRAEGAKEKSDGAKGIQRKRPQSMHSRIRPDEEMQTQDDSNIGVSRLTQAFERSTRSQTISHSDRRKKPDVLPKPKPALKPGKSQTLERNYRFPVPSSKPSETTVQKKPNDVVVLDDVPEKAIEKKESVLSPTKKAPPPKPKLLPKPQPKAKPTMSNATAKLADEGKENVKKTQNTPPVTNGSLKMSGKEFTHGDEHTTGDESKDALADLPSFWARRSVFSPEQKNNSTPSQDEKTKEKHTRLIQLKTDSCAVCGSKVYQMEKFKVKDNIVHRSCIKCSVCKRLLSVGNFIMSQNKIYCKPHEPHIAVSLTTV